MNCNSRGFTRAEVDSCINSIESAEYEILSIEEIEKYNLQGDESHKQLMNAEVFHFLTWKNAYLDNNINGFRLPLKVEKNTDYVSELKNIYSRYLKELDKPAFAYEDGLLFEIRETCCGIVQCLDLLIEQKTDMAREKIKGIIKKYISDSFMVSSLDKSYSFRGVAPFEELQNTGYGNAYKTMNSQELTFFRVRTKKKDDNDDIFSKEHIVHLPYAMKDKANDMRFSRMGVPCLYLGVTSYVCCKECKWNPDIEDMFSAAFVPNEKGKNLSILNLTVSQALINGIFHRGVDAEGGVRKELQMKMLKIFPLVIATSFSIKEEGRKIKYEYLISQILMEAIRELNIDGIAYLSMKGKDEFQYPHGVNLALPAWDICEETQYSKYCAMFNMTNPVQFHGQTKWKTESYINAVYKKKDECGQESFMAKKDVDGQDIFYGETKYGVFDNYLVSQKMERFMK